MSTSESVPFSRRDGLVASALAIVVFSTCLALALAFDRVGVNDQWNVVFDADPNTRIGAMADGWGTYGRNLAHPNLSNLVNPPIRLVGGIVAAVTGTDAASVRRDLTLGLAPLGAALQVFVAYFLFRRWTSTRGLAIALTLLAAGSFTTLVFGSIPDHFALGGLALALALLLASGPRPGRWRWAAWVGLGVFALGVTLTNVLPIAIVLFAGLVAVGESPRRASIHTVVWSVAVLAVSGLLFFTMNRVYAVDPETEQDVEWVEDHWLREPVSERSERIAPAIAGAFAPARVSLRDNRLATVNQSRHRFRFSLLEPDRVGTPAGGDPIGRALVPVVLGGLLVAVVRGLRRGGRARWLTVGAVGVLGFHASLHTVWGSEPFLYSQHWHVAALLLIAVAVGDRRPARRWTVTILVVAILTVAQNTLHLRQMLDALSS